MSKLLVNEIKSYTGSTVTFIDGTNVDITGALTINGVEVGNNSITSIENDFNNNRLIITKADDTILYVSLLTDEFQDLVADLNAQILKQVQDNADRIAADVVLQSNINTEITARELGDQSLLQGLSNESQTRQSNDANLQDQINANDTDIAQLTSDLADEASTREGADQNLENSKVPYTGATTNVDLGVHSLKTALLQLTGGTGTQGEMYWNPDEETVDVIMNGAVLQMGQEVYVHVRNNTASTIPNATPVYITGTLGASGRLTVAPMIADGSIEPKYFIGVTTEDIEAGGDGKITWFGKVRHFDTSIFPEGTTLYVSETTAGGWQTTKPIEPHPDIEVAFTINSENNGTIFVRGEIPKNLSHLYDVKINNASAGEIVQFNSATNSWENTDGLQEETADRIAADDALQTQIDGIETDLSNYQLRSEKGQPNGYASLDENGTVPTSQLPESVTGALEYQGVWDASTDTPTLPTADASNKGHFYKVSVAGTYNGEDFHVGDWALSDGVSWSHIHTQETVSDVFGREGSIVAQEADYSAFYPLIQDLADETLARTNADTNLQNQIDSNDIEIAQNTSDISTNAINISFNTSAIEAEVITRGNADTTLQNNINAEETARIAGDANLQAQIDNFNPTQDLQSVTDAGSATTTSIEAASFIKTGGGQQDILYADGNSAPFIAQATNDGVSIDPNAPTGFNMAIGHGNTSNVLPGSYGGGDQYIKSLNVDSFGHTTGLTTAYLPVDTLDAVTTEGNTTLNDITVNNITQSNSNLLLDAQYAGYVSSVGSEDITTEQQVNPEYSWEMYEPYEEGGNWEVVLYYEVIDQIAGGDPNALIGKTLNLSGNDGNEDYTGTGTILPLDGFDSGYYDSGYYYVFAGSITFSDYAPGYASNYDNNASLLVSSLITVDVIQTVNVEPIAENVDYVMSKSATRINVLINVLGSGSIEYSGGYYFVTDVLIDGWGDDTELVLELANGEQIDVITNGLYGSGPYEYYYYPTTNNDFDYYTVTGVFKSYIAEVYSVDVSGGVTTIKTAERGLFSTNDDVWLHQSKSKIQVVDKNFEPLEILNYDRITNTTTTTAKSYIDKNSYGGLVDRDTQETLVDTGKIQSPGIMLLTETAGGNNFNGSTASAYGSVVMSIGNWSLDAGSISNSMLIGRSFYLGQGMTSSTLIGSYISNFSSYSSHTNVMIGGNNALYNGDNSSSSGGPSRNILIGNSISAARPYSVGIGSNLGVYDGGATSVNKPYTFEYNVGVLIHSNISLGPYQELYLQKLSFGSSSWTTTTPTVTDSNMKYLFNTKMMNNRSTTYTDSCMKIRINGVFKDKTSDQPISIDKVFVYYWIGFAWEINLENEREGDRWWDVRVTFINSDNFVISISNQDGAYSRVVYGVNLNVEVTFTS